MNIHKEGKIWVAACLIVYGILIVCYFNWPNIFVLIGLLFFGIFLLLVLNFFRNPTRLIPQSGDHLIYAPADGKIVVIEETFESEYFKDKRRLVSIFMNPLDVHVNRYPVSGTISYAEYHHGKYLVAWHPKSSSENERTTVVIKTAQGEEILLRQIAGALAKRICCYAKVNDIAQQGQDFGFIKFGSRVDIYLPLTATIKVSLNQVVKGNLDLIATLV